MLKDNVETCYTFSNNSIKTGSKQTTCVITKKFKDK